MFKLTLARVSAKRCSTPPTSSSFLPSQGLEFVQAWSEWLRKWSSWALSQQEQNHKLWSGLGLWCSFGSHHVDACACGGRAGGKRESYSGGPGLKTRGFLCWLWGLVLPHRVRLCEVAVTWVQWHPAPPELDDRLLQGWHTHELRAPPQSTLQQDAALEQQAWHPWARALRGDFPGSHQNWGDGHEATWAEDEKRCVGGTGSALTPAALGLHSRGKWWAFTVHGVFQGTFSQGNCTK